MTSERMMHSFLQTLKGTDDFFSDCEETSRENTLRLTYTGGDNMDEINLYISFSLLDSGAMLVNANCFDLPNFNNNLQAGYKACNEANDEESVQFYIDDDNDAIASAALYFNAFGFFTDFSPEMAVEMAIRLALSVDSAYPFFARAAY